MHLIFPNGDMRIVVTKLRIRRLRDLSVKSCSRSASRTKKELISLLSVFCRGLKI